MPLTTTEILDALESGSMEPAEARGHLAIIAGIIEHATPAEGADVATLVAFGEELIEATEAAEMNATPAEREAMYKRMAAAGFDTRIHEDEDAADRERDRLKNN